MTTLEHCVVCFDSILHHLNQPVDEPIVRLDSTDKYPLFVTWKKNSSTSWKSAIARAAAAAFDASSAATAVDAEHQWRLRGCIGTFAPKELRNGLREYAVISAFKDSRFSPITDKEVPHLRVDVSLLTNFEPAASYKDWIVGTHGIQIDFHPPGASSSSSSSLSSSSLSSRAYSATYLPEVAAEQGWDHEQTIEELVYKSGYRGACDDALKQRIRLTRYQSSKMGMTWVEYVQWKKSHAHASK